MRQEKQKKRGGEKAKSKSQDCCVTFKPKNYVEILLSAHARTSPAHILHLDQKAAKCTTIFLNGQQIQHEYVRTELTVYCIRFC